MDDANTSLGPERLDAATLGRFRLALVRRRDAIGVRLGASAARNARAGVGGATVIGELERALVRIDSGEFGRCKACVGTVETERLEADFTTRVCLAHYSADEIRELERDLECAAAVQRDLSPRRVPVCAGLELAARTRPARIVGGDYHDFFALKGGALGVAVGDVMGKGLAASLLVAHLQAALRLLAADHDEPSELARRVDLVFRYHLNVISFVTLAIARVEPASGRLTWCSAGHEPALWWRAEARELRHLPPTGPAIGLVPGASHAASAIELGRGDVVLLASDGVLEAKDRGGALFGEERLAALVRAGAAEGAERLVERVQTAVEAFAGGAAQDDLTLVALRRS